MNFRYLGAAVTFSLHVCPLYSTFMSVQEINSTHFKVTITSDMDTKTNICGNRLCEQIVFNKYVIEFNWLTRIKT